MYPHLIHLHGPWDVVDKGGQRFSVAFPATLSLPKGGELRRSFQWVSPTRTGERIFLTLDRLVGLPRLVLNDQEIPITFQPWLPIRIDVTDRLRPRNQLTLLYSDSPSLAGVRESVHLSIESEFAQNVRIEWDWNEPTEDPSFRARMTFESSNLSGPAREVELLVELNQQSIIRQPVLLDGGINHINFQHGPVDVDPWRPSTVGLPVRQDMRVVLSADDYLLWQRSMLVGFRQVDATRGDDGSVIIAGKHEFRRSNDLIAGDIDLWGSDRTSGESEASGRVDLVGELAGQAFYDWADRRGLLVCHDGIGDPDLERAVRRRSEHPCVVLLPNRSS
jgi:hypothetical protein